MTFSASAHIRLPEDSKSTPIYSENKTPIGSKSTPTFYEQGMNSHDDDSSQRIPKSHEFKNLIRTYTKDGGKSWPKNTHDDTLISRKNNYDDDTFYSSTYRQVLETGLTTLRRDEQIPYDKDQIKHAEKGDRWTWPIQANQNYHYYKEAKRQLDLFEDQYLAFAKFLRAPIDDRFKDPTETNGYYKKRDPYTLYKQFRKEQQLRSKRDNEEYERDIEMQSEITYSALKKQLAMAKDKETNDPYNLYKTLNRKFKRSNTEDFFRDPVAACVEVLERISAWIAEKLSLPPPDPVDYDTVIYKREDTTNYSYLSTVIKNKKVQFLVARDIPFNDSQSFGYMFLNE